MIDLRWPAKPPIERFRKKFRVDGSGCWLWIASRLRDGYGQFGMGSRRDGTITMKRAHRAAWELFVGPIPDGLDVLHRCDVPACVNPDHLWLGTAKDNVRDMVSKGRDDFRGRKRRALELGNANSVEPVIR